MLPDIALYYPLDVGLQLFYVCTDPELPRGRGLLERVVRQVADRDDGYYGAIDEILRPDGGAEELRQFDVLLSGVGARQGGRWILNNPLTPGRSWEDEADTFTLVSINEGIRVPAGSFAGCLKVTYNNEDTGGGILWFAPNVGIIKEEQYGERGPYTLELESARNQTILYRR